MIAPESLQESLANDLKQLSEDEDDDVEIVGNAVTAKDLKHLSDDSILTSRSNSMKSFKNSESIQQFKTRIDTMDEEMILENRQEDEKENG